MPKKDEKQKKRLQFLYLVRNYIETSPSKEFVASEIKRSKALIVALQNRIPSMPESMSLTEYNKFKKSQEKELGITKLKQQLKTLYFIRNSKPEQYYE